VAERKETSNTKSFHVDNMRLKSFIERIERVTEERDALSGDIRDIYSEAKSVGYDVGTMRKVIRLRAMDAADRAEREALLETYLHALGMVDRIKTAVESGATYRAAAKAEGVSATKVHRLVTKTREKAEPRESKHDPETGEVIEKPAGPPGERAGTLDLADEAGSSLASIGEEAGGHSRAEADIGASIEPAAVTPAVNADPLVGHELPHDENGQGSEVGTYSTSCGDPDSLSEIGRGPELSAALAASDRVRSSDAGVAPGPHGTESRSLAVPASAEVDSAVVPIRKDGRAGERDTVITDPNVAAMLAASQAQADIDTTIPPFLDRRPKRGATA